MAFKKARIRFHKPNSLEDEYSPKANAEIIVTDEDKSKVYITIPMSSLAYALMGVSGIDCEMEITKNAKQV